MFDYAARHGYVILPHNLDFGDILYWQVLATPSRTTEERKRAHSLPSIRNERMFAFFLCKCDIALAAYQVDGQSVACPKYLRLTPPAFPPSPR
jgi:hypothetical protein